MLKLLITILVVLFFGPVGNAAGSGWIHIIVQDMSGSVVPGVKVSILRVDHDTPSLSSLSTERGEVTFHIPDGMYLVTANDPRIVPYKRARIAISHGEHKYVVIIPLFISVVAEEAAKQALIRYRDFIARPTGDHVSIRFTETVSSDQSVHFTGHVELSFGTVTAICNVLTHIEADDLLLCSEDVRLFVGRDYFPGTLCRVDLRTREVKLTRDAVLNLQVQ